MTGDDDGIGYLRGRLEGHGERITNLENAFKDGMQNINVKLTAQDGVLNKIQMLLSRWIGAIAAVSVLAGAGGALIIAAVEGHWRLF